MGAGKRAGLVPDALFGFGMFAGKRALGVLAGHLDESFLSVGGYPEQVSHSLSPSVIHDARQECNAAK
jgi:hypothetical protein